MPKFSPLRTFMPVFTSTSRMIDIWGGRGRGGSHFGTDYFLFLMTRPVYFRGYFIRKAFADIRHSLFQDFKDRINDNGTVDPSDFTIQENEMRVIYRPTGNMIISKGAQKDGSRTAKMKSLAGATHVLIEEADELSEDDFDQLDLSLRTTKANQIQIIRIFNPPSKFHWIWRDYTLIDAPGYPGYFKAVAREDSDLTSIFSTYHDNRRFINASTIQKYESFKEKNSEYYHTVILGLVSEGSKGRIYNGWNVITDEQFNAIDARSVYCIDFGYSDDPNAVAEFKTKYQSVYGRELLYQSGLDNIALAKKLCDLGITKKDLIIADYGNGGDVRIAELRRGFNAIPGYPQLIDGFNIIPCFKPAITVGISMVKSHDVYWTESSTNAWFEYQEYKWAMDRDKNPTDQPVDKYNHLLDGLRYRVTMKLREQ